MLGRCFHLYWLPHQSHSESLMGLFARYLKYSRQTIVRAKHEADRFGSPEIDPEHILLALINDPVLTSRMMQGTSEKEIVMKIEAHIPRGERNPLPHDLELSKTTREVLVLAEGEADKLGHQDIRNEHILLGLVESGNSFAAKLLAEEGLSADHLRRQIESSSC
jgi:ATP-dependent Clp protease ATP-binding subunit ClpA